MTAVPGNNGRSLGGRWQLPENWQWVEAGDVAHVVGGGTPKNAKDPANYDDDGTPWITPADLSGFTGVYIERGKRSLSEHGLARSSARKMPKGTLLFTSRAPVGYCAIAKNEVTTNQGFRSFILPEGIVPEYVRYYLLASIEYIKSFASGTTFLELSGSNAARIQWPIAPTAEQRRIVEKLDELFSDIDEGEACLKRAQALATQYRQSVLKAAVTGELTREWRERNIGKGETGADLLERILAARREAWEAAELAKMKAKGQTPNNDKWKAKYKAPKPTDASRLPKLPEGWLWASLDMVADLTGGVTVDAKRSVEGGVSVPYLRVANVQRGFLDLGEIKHITVSEAVVAKLKLKRNDVLFNEGGDIDKLGRGWIWQNELDECIHQNHVFRARLYCQDLRAKLVSCFGNVMGKAYFMGEGKQTTNLASLSLSRLRSFPIPVPPPAEAEVVEQLIDEALSICTKWDQELTNAELLTLSLRQSVIKSAFRGKLVRQNPNDEPASILLERIASERELGQSGTKKQTRRRKTDRSQMELH